MTASLNATNIEKPICLHPDNPHYFLFRGRPTVLITSGEHYGAVLNLDFDYAKYLDELQACGLNHTRIFSGTYHEISNDFGIDANTLAPQPGRLVCPWKLVEGVSGAENAKYDLNSWDEAYYTRLKDFCRKASERGIVIELVLFCPNYWERHWEFSPMYVKNNVNGVGDVPLTESYTVKHPDLMACQAGVTRKIVCELNSFDNIFYQICNEPWVNGVEMEWQAFIADTIQQAEAELPRKHLISEDVCNGRKVIENPHPGVSIFNFHYANPPDAVTLNSSLGTVIGLNETGFNGRTDYVYRYQAWEFIMAGGALYNNLDYSFAVGYEDGTYAYPDHTPGGGSTALRKQLKILRDFIESFDLIRMKPDQAVLKRLHVMNGTGYMMAERGKAYALYIRAFAEGILDLDVPPGRYAVEWINPKTGEVEAEEQIDHQEGDLRMIAPPYQEDIALRMKAV